MNTKMFKGVGAAISLIVGMGAASPVLATSTGRQTLGTPTGATDVFTFNCGFSSNAAANVADLDPPFNVPPRMRVMLVKGGAAAQREDDTPPTTGGEDGAASGNAVLPGIGNFSVLFFKTAPGVEAYEGNVVCNGLPPAFPFNPVLNRTQNQ